MSLVLAEVRAAEPLPRKRSTNTQGEAQALARKLSSGEFIIIPLTKLPSGHFRVDVRIGDRSLGLILDTGAPKLVIDKATADQLSLPVLRTGVASGIGSSEIRSDLVSVKKLTLQAAESGRTVEWLNVPAVVMDVSVIRATGENELQGILGAELLEASGAIIDLRGGRLLLPVQRP